MSESLLVESAEAFPSVVEEIVAKGTVEHSRVTIDAMRSVIDISDPEQSAEIAFLERRLGRRELKGCHGLHAQVLATVLAALQESGARSVLDVGCGEGMLLAGLAAEGAVDRALGVDIKPYRVAQARAVIEALGYADQNVGAQVADITQFNEENIGAWEAVVLAEVIEHIDDPDWASHAFALRPDTLVVTTPNRDVTDRLAPEFLAPNGLRHMDHKFEFSQEEFADWSARQAFNNGYIYHCQIIDHAVYGPASQIAVFKKP